MQQLSKPEPDSFRRRYLPASRSGWLLLGLVFLLLWFGTLQYRSLFDTDEGRYAEIPREMLVTGNWLTPHLNGVIYLEKPPLQYWATAAAFTLFGQHNWTARLWTALTGFAGLLVVWGTGRRLFGKRAGLLSALILASSFLYLGLGHINTLDMGVTFFMTLALCGFLLAQDRPEQVGRRRGWMLLAWAAMAGAFLSKGLIGLLLPGGVLVLYTLWQRDWRLWSRLHLVTGLALFLLLALPWLVLEARAVPGFLKFFFITQQFARYLTKVANRYQPWWWFVPILVLGIVPWLIPMLEVVATRWRAAAARGQFDPQRFLWLWAVFIFAFFSFSDSKLAQYILPILPALALLMGDAISRNEGRGLRWTVALSLALGILGVYGALHVSHMHTKLISAEMFSRFSHWLLAAALLAVAGSLASAALWRRRALAATVAGLALTWSVGFQLVMNGAEVVAPTYSTRSLVQQIRPQLAPGEPFYVVGRYDQTLPFYLKRTVTLVAYKGELAFGIERDASNWLPSKAAFRKRWRRDSRAMAMMREYTYRRFRKEGLPMQVAGRDPRWIVVKKP